MQLNEKLGAIEAILFSCGEPVDEFRLAESAGIGRSELSTLIKSLNQRYGDLDSALHIVRLSGKYQMCTQKKYSDYIKSAMEIKKQTPLSQAAMEALTVVALLEEDGRLDVPGKPVAYRTTDTFLRSFGLSSLSELPPLEREEENKQQSLIDNQS